MHISTFHFKLKQVNLHLFLDGDPRLYIDGSERSCIFLSNINTSVMHSVIYILVYLNLE